MSPEHTAGYANLVSETCCIYSCGIAHEVYALLIPDSACLQRCAREFLNKFVLVSDFLRFSFSICAKQYVFILCEYVRPFSYVLEALTVVHMTGPIVVPLRKFQRNGKRRRHPLSYFLCWLSGYSIKNISVFEASLRILCLANLTTRFFG